MNIDPRTFSLIKIILLAALCLYIVLSALFYVYLQLRFFDPLYFRKIILQILAVTAIFLFDLFLSVRQEQLRKTNRGPSRLSYILTVACTAGGYVVFSRLAAQTAMASTRFLSLYIPVILILSVYEFITCKP